MEGVGGQREITHNTEKGGNKEKGREGPFRDD